MLFSDYPLLQIQINLLSLGSANAISQSKSIWGRLFSAVRRLAGSFSFRRRVSSFRTALELFPVQADMSKEPMSHGETIWLPTADEQNPFGSTLKQWETIVLFAGESVCMVTTCMRVTTAQQER